MDQFSLEPLEHLRLLFLIAMDQISNILAIAMFTDIRGNEVAERAAEAYRHRGRGCPRHCALLVQCRIKHTKE